MGGILSRLYDHNFCPSAINSIPDDVFVDFENAQPLADETELYNEIEELTKTADILLKDLEAYTGAGAAIKKAFESATVENEKNAWKNVAPRALKLKECFDMSHRLASVGPKIFTKICTQSQSTGGVVELLEFHQALIKQFAKVVDSVMFLDNLKMSKPEINNDFSFFRRLRTKMSKINNTPEVGTGNNPFVFDDKISQQTNDLASNMRLINDMTNMFARPTPFLSTFTESLSKFVKESEQVVAERTPEMIGTMATVCQKMLDNPALRSKMKNITTEPFIVRVVVGLVILYDHVDPKGVFVKGSKVDVKGIVKTICEFPDCDKLLDAIRYTTVHLNDESTPKDVKKIVVQAKGLNVPVSTKRVSSFKRCDSIADNVENPIVS